MAKRQPTQKITGRTTNANIVFGIIASEPNVGEIIDGSSSNDRLFGSNNDDTLNGGLGNDTLYGEFGNDLLKGGNNDDRLFGGDGQDILEGSTGNDTLRGESENDRLFGGDDDDQLLGGDEQDTLEGGAGNDTLRGESGSDRLNGDYGNDSLEGGAGNDYLDGFGGEGKEIDSLTGGLGSDIFVIGDATGVDYQSGANEDTEDLAFAIISDFSATDDFIQASGNADNYDLVSGDLLGDGIQDTGIYLGDDLIAIAENVTIDNYDRFVFPSDSDLSFANDLVKALQASIATS